MLVPRKVLNFLKKNKIKYEIIEHKTVYTAFDKARTLKLKPDIIGKTLILKKIEFVSERLMKNKLKGIKIGATPPFGELFGFPTFINKSLLNKPKIIVNSGHYNSSVKIKGSFLKKLMPDMIVGSFAKSKK
jgi:prolyl-tRNA editing enzyme YbaK/EbsC (Cys-tRNA(Pro) deacylase)